MAEERRKLRKKAALFCLAIIVLAYVSCGIMGAYDHYMVFNPAEVTAAFLADIHDLVGGVTHLWAPYTDEQLAEMFPTAANVVVWERAGVVLLTLLCGALLAVSGMLFQNVFKNPLAGPGMLGVSSGVSLGVVVLVMMYGTAAAAMTSMRLALCYLFGAAILAFVMGAGKWISGARPFNLVDMLLVGSITAQLLGVVSSFIVLWILDDEAYITYFTISQMLVVDTSLATWVALAVALVASFVPIWLLLFRMNALAFSDTEIRLMGISPAGIKGIALLCGSIMILAAQAHVGMIGMVTLVVPFLARSWFGCEMRKQFAGNVLLGPLLVLLCRDVADLIPFVGDGIGIGSVVGIVILPIIIYVFARGSRAWE